MSSNRSGWKHHPTVQPQPRQVRKAMAASPRLQADSSPFVKVADSTPRRNPVRLAIRRVGGVPQNAGMVPHFLIWTRGQPRASVRDRLVVCGPEKTSMSTTTISQHGKGSGTSVPGSRPFLFRLGSSDWPASARRTRSLRWDVATAHTSLCSAALAWTFPAGMLAAARLRTPNPLVRADVAELPFRTDSFDVVLAPFMLYHVSHREAAVRELRRVLRPSGVQSRKRSGTNADRIQSRRPHPMPAERGFGDRRRSRRRLPAKRRQHVRARDRRHV
jgi:hypothetical protein